ncbi:ead/Ea22-like family protein [Klebsiella pneumoniae]|uniref:ead/Ea22-like family protein n=1 Tax=Klebsiella pneumoniae TaxID=573 RepID=UPI001D0D24CD|nr:ead/Ea22-like family protein [Klebsiella pneumoniae]
MTTDITELAHGNSLRKKLNRRLNDAYGFQRTSGGKHTTISLSIAECKSVIAALGEHLTLVEALETEKRICATWRKTAESTSEKLEKAQAAERRWHRVASRVHEQACESDVKIDELEAIRAAAEKLVRCKGRYHSEQNYRALAALFGVKTPDLPPLEHENVHYADAAEMEIAALRQRIAELESRTVKLPDELSGETLLDVASSTDLVYSDDTGVLEYTNINGCFVKVTAPPDKVIRFRSSNKCIYIRLVDRVKAHENAGIIIDFHKNNKDFIQ